MPPAATPVPPPAPGAVPLAVLVDYDGTISVRDIGDVLMERYFPDAALAAATDAAFDRGEITSRDLVRWDMAVLPREPDLLRAAAAALEQDAAFPSFVAWVRSLRGTVEVVSDGLGFYVGSNLASLDASLADLPVATNGNLVDGPDGVSFPFANPLCDACGTCKRERVRVHRAAGWFVAVVGDGTTDRYAAHEADLTLAKGKLLAWASTTGHDAMPWRDFRDVRAALEAALADGLVPATADALAARRAVRPVPGDPPICGPEVWGPAALRTR
jgi:2-hydroxy-3-keto-5-methylthiopentenyl-1-phosphate phosphatase